MELTDLEKDPQKFLENTADEVYGELAVIQRHFEMMLAGKDALWCLACTFKHFAIVGKNCQECIGGACPVQPIWQEMADWAEQKKKRVLELIKKKEKPSDVEAQQIAEQARKYRKEMEKILVGEVLPEEQSTQEHVS